MPQQFGPRDLKEVPYLVVYKIIFIISVVVKVYIEYEHALMIAVTTKRCLILN